MLVIYFQHFFHAEKKKKENAGDVPQNLDSKYANNTYENTFQNLNIISCHSSNPEPFFKNFYFTSAYLLLKKGNIT